MNEFGNVIFQLKSDYVIIIILPMIQFILLQLEFSFGLSYTNMGSVSIANYSYEFYFYHSHLPKLNCNWPHFRTGGRRQNYPRHESGFSSHMYMHQVWAKTMPIKVFRGSVNQRVKPWNVFNYNKFKIFIQHLGWRTLICECNELLV